MDSFKDIAEAFLNAVKSDTDTHTSIKGEIIKNSESSFSLLTPDHIQYAVNGRGSTRWKFPFRRQLIYQMGFAKRPGKNVEVTST